MTNALQPIEDMIGTGLNQTVGDPIFAGLLLLFFFVGYVFISGISYDGKIAVLIPAFILFAIISLSKEFGGVIVLGFGILLFIGLMRIFGK